MTSPVKDIDPSRLCDAPVLQVRNLSVEADAGARMLQLIEDVSLHLSAGESLGLIGESGSGKSITSRALLGILPSNARITGGEILLEERNLARCPEKAWRAIRGAQIAMVFQDPMRSLNPTMTVGHQVMESIAIHRPDTSKGELREMALDLFNKVRIPDSVRRFSAYPHQFSGGMRQRICIAMALGGDPRLLIADEATTALDVTIQAEILDLLDELRRERKMALMLITHDLGVAASHTDRICVMYAGKIVESGPTADVLAAPRMPYTRGLLDAVPTLDGTRAKLKSVRGMPPSPAARPDGCAFNPRCDRALEICAHNAPGVTEIDGARSFRCWHPLEIGDPDA